jgi:hypothetical protein
MRGCLTLLTFVAGVIYVFVGLGLSIGLFLIGFGIWCLLVLLAYVCTTISDKLTERKNKSTEDDESPIR